MKYFISILLSILIFSCSTTKKTVNYESFTIPISLHEFLKDFENAVIQHNKQKMLSLMDEEYLREQHDKMLEGRTDQFLNELLCGTTTNTNEFKCPGFQNIKFLKLIDLQIKSESYTVKYMVKTELYEIFCELEITVKQANKTFNYGIFGAMG